MRKAEYNGAETRTRFSPSGFALLPSFFSTLLSVVFTVLLMLPSPAGAASRDLEVILKKHLKEHYPWADVEVSGLKLSNEAPDDTPTAITVEKTPPGRTVFHLEYRGNRGITATAAVKAFDRIIMSRGAFRKGYTLARDDVYSTLMDITRVPKGAVRNEELVIGKPLMCSIIANAPLTDTMVSDGPMVKRGRKIMLLAAGSGITIKAPGEIKQDAVVGDYVRAMNLLSKQIITGLLVDVNTVRVEF